MPHVVFAWEIGSGFGHLVPIATLGESFRRQGHRVTAVVPPSSRGRQVLAPLGIDVVELTTHTAPWRSFSLSVNYTGNLLRNGFAHAETVAARVDEWRMALERLEPDLLICDHAPSALLASRGARYARTAMGNGFTLPPLSAPMPNLQPWFRTPADRLADTDREFLDTVNRVLARKGITALATVSSLFDGVDRRLHIEAELDHYPHRDETYLGAIDPAASLFAGAPSLRDAAVFVYLAANNRFLEAVLDTLARRGVEVDAYITGGTSPHRQGPGIRYLDAPVDLRHLAGRYSLAITHGGTLSASLLLRSGVRLLICPEDLEKAVLATRLRQNGLAYSFNWFAPGVDHVPAVINRLLDSSEAPLHLPAFVASHAGRRPDDNVMKTVERCESRIEAAAGR